MTRAQKILKNARERPNNLAFHDFCALMEGAGYELRRQRGSHHIYYNPAIRHVFPVQNEKGQAVAYQVRAILKKIEEFQLIQE